MANGCSSSCDGESDYESGVTPKRDKSTKKKAEQWLWYHVRNIEWMYCIFQVIKYTWVPLNKTQSVKYKYVCYISKQGEPKVHNLLHVNTVTT